MPRHEFRIVVFLNISERVVVGFFAEAFSVFEHLKFLDVIND